MTTAIALLVIASIITSIAVVSGAIYLGLHKQSVDQSKARQLTNLGVAATILEKRMSGSVVNWTAEGDLRSFETWSIPTFLGDEVIRSVAQVTTEDASIYAFDSVTQDLLIKTTTIKGVDGAAIINDALDPSNPALTRVMAGEASTGESTIAGTTYLAAFYPIKKMSGEVIGAVFVGTPTAKVEAAANGIMGLIGVVGGIVTLVLGLVGFALSRRITKPIPRLAKSMNAIAQGKHEESVPFVALGNEVGDMARAVEVFRRNGQRVSQMTEAEADRVVQQEQERQAMMAELRDAFGIVVDAAVAGDFSRQVTVEFPDPELNALAGGINNLVSTFNRGVSEIGDVLGAMANTDLTQRMEGDYEGAFATLKADINAVADKLTEVVGQLRHTSGSLKTATGEILSGADDLSERTTKQAATIEETSAAMEQLAATVLKNAQRAKDASAGAMQVTRTAEEGGQVMDAATSAMERITQSSAKISNIIGMIDDIAFQTNLLALNASVEAARAGDAGKGFAVVAVEVRRLAQSAAQASSEVKVLIEQSAGEVNTGSKLVGEAAGKLKAMLDEARGNNVLLESIANDSREQASAIEEVTTAVRTMDEMTQHNAALVEETNAAIEQTEAQATELDRIVDVFRIGDRQEAAPVHERPPVGTARGLQQRLAAASVNRATRGNAALQPDWNEF